MDINGASEVAKVITQSAFKVSEISNEDLRKKKIREDKDLSLNPNKSYHVDSEVNSIYPTNEIKDDNINFTVLSKSKSHEKDTDGVYDVKFNDPKIGRKVDIER
ncbi:hypothetical protein DB313_01375 [Borrelia turcica IST7]|uniref:Uncharacterized protein n=1 Tax=Borrelia turcica IST7 TaxID=1104446 RepID=A0A386PMI1_9SPIR|nr:hypothetical protein [Borrelia turcica]AYE36153.1 hypothetical protein DB313_01375 [Borrelia turcica IST7]